MREAGGVHAGFEAQLFLEARDAEGELAGFREVVAAPAGEEGDAADVERLEDAFQFGVVGSRGKFGVHR